MPNRLVFTEEPTIVLGTNRFTRVPVILEYEGQPIIEVVQDIKSKWTTQMQIFDDDGNYIAKVKGTRVFAGPDWTKRRLEMRHPGGGQHICTMDGHTLFELRRSEAAAVAISAELRTQDGRFVRFDDDLAGELCAINEGSIEILGRVTMTGSTFTDLRAGISVHADGSVAVGVS